MKILPLLAATAVALTASAADLPRTYTIGNSLTDHFLADKRDYNPNGPAVDRILKAAGLGKWEIGAKNIAGSPLWWHWYHPKDGGRAPFGSTEALAKYEWDQLTLQPFDGTLHSTTTKEETTKGGVTIPAGSEKGDVAMSINFIRKALENPANADMQVFIYSTWVRFPEAAKKKAKAGEPVTLEEADFEELWLRKNARPQTFTREYFEALKDELRKEQAPGGKLADLKKPVRLIPMGDVFLALDRKLRAGELDDLDPKTEWKDIRDAFQPGLGIHASPIGQIVVAYVFYSTLLGKSPVGLDIRSLLHEPTETGLNLSDEQLRVIQETVWEVVKNHPSAGLAGS